MKIHSVKFNAIMNAILTSSSFIFPLITVPYVSRVLSVEENGAIAFAQYVVQLFGYVTVLGIPTYGIRECAKIRDDKRRLAATTKELLVILIVSTAACYVVYIVAVWTIPKLASDKPLFLIFSINLVLSTFGIEWFYQALEQYTYITVRNLIFKFVAVVLMFALVRNAQDTLAYAGVIVFANSMSNLINIFRMTKLVDLKRSNTGKLKFRRHIKPMFVFFIANFAKNFYLSADIVLLGFFSTNFQVGLYQFVVKLKGVLVSGVSSVGNVMIPRLSYFISKGLSDSFIRLIRKNLDFLCFVGLGIAAYIWVFADDIVGIVAGPAFSGAASPLRVIGIVVFLTCINIVTGIQILVPLGREKVMATSCVVGAVISVSFNVAFDHSLGALAPALAIMLTEAVICIAQIIFCWDVLKRSFNVINTAKILVVLVIATVATVLFAAVQIPAGRILLFILRSSFFGGIFLGGSLLLHENTSIMLSRLVARRRS